MSFTVSNNAYLSKLYLGYESYTKKSERTEVSPLSLAQADTHALGRGIKVLNRLDYGSGNDTKTSTSSFYKRMKSFADTYNYTLESSSQIERSDIRRMVKKITKLSEQYGSKLSSLGIKFDEKTGYMSIDEYAMGEKDEAKFEKFFGKDSSFMKKLSKINKSLNNRINYLV